MSTTIHPFEAAGLGKAPFICRGVFEKVGPIVCADGITQIGAPGQPMGSCDYCGTGIRYCCDIRSADGKEFIVGTDCVLKLERESNSKLVKVVETEKKKLAKIAAAASAKRRREAGFAKTSAAYAALQASPEKQAALAARPHPYKPLADEGKTLLDYVDWMFKHAGLKGMLEVVKILEKYP